MGCRFFLSWRKGQAQVGFYLSPASARGCRGSARRIDLCGMSFFHSLETKMAVGWRSILKILGLSPWRQHHAAHSIQLVFAPSMARRTARKTGFCNNNCNRWCGGGLKCEFPNTTQSRGDLPGWFQVQPAVISTINPIYRAALKTFLTTWFTPWNIPLVFSSNFQILAPSDVSSHRFPLHPTCKRGRGNGFAVLLTLTGHNIWAPW